jgi:hypothetical protein
MSSAYEEGSTEARIGRMSSIPTKALIAVGVWRMMVASPSAISPRAKRYKPPPKIARSALGSEREAVGVFPERICWPIRNEENETTSPMTSVMVAKTATFAANNQDRRGTAANESRIVPVLYSALTTSTPSTPIASWAKSRPERLDLVGSKVNCAATDRDENRDALAEVTIAPKPTPMKTVINKVQSVERTERNFVHSERTMPQNP